MNRNPFTRLLAEAERRARVVNAGASEATSPSVGNSGAVAAATVVNGELVMYGLLGITPLGASFRLS